ncbi:MAG: hypothetical protein K8J09_03380 [Planctomycetes bacterium]|nr:hypothetical protein [Planctomycetota bacterium]MCC7398710.1 hypothetical protein [Planctomycetota bacterium]
MSSAPDLWSLLAAGLALLWLPALWRLCSTGRPRPLPPTDATGDSVVSPPPAA